jgi:hypothetical protein
MHVASKPVVALYVDKVSQQWVVRDSEGTVWSPLSTNKPWDERQPFSPTEETERAPVPGHYKYMVGLPL